MARQISRIGFAQVELNKVAGGMIDGKLFDMLPVNQTVLGSILEQGRFVKYDVANQEINLTGKGPWVMVYNEEEFYDERDWNHKDYAMKAEDRLSGEMVPRCYLISLGDTFTTNSFAPADGAVVKNLNKNTESTGISIENTDTFGVDKTTGYLTNDSSAYDADGPLFKVDPRITTLPDSQAGVKLYCIQ